MDNLLGVHVAVAANRTFSRSALPDAPTVATQQRPAAHQLRRRVSWRLHRIVGNLDPA
jgi:hypothetical protein